MANSKYSLLVIGLLVIGLLIVSCAESPYQAPVTERHNPSQRLYQSSYSKLNVHLVVQGETLYSIAWSYGMDYRKLAKINRIAPPYLIYPQQELHLKPGTGGRLAELRPKAGKPSRREKAKKRPIQARNKIIQAFGPIRESTPRRTPANSSQKLLWQWPTLGRLSAKFSPSKASSGNKGIDISGQKGQAVRAASPGLVVYAGNGLRGYGDLIIIKHNDLFLSAYAHNSIMLVSEGRELKAGEKIAEVGYNAAGKAVLHFEIRKEGKPVDPLKYLPSS